MIKKYDVKVCHCPTAGAAGGYSTFKVGKFVEMIEKGITVGLGADSAAESNFIDMIRVAYMATATEMLDSMRLFSRRKSFWRYSTIYGAKALLSEDKVGSLEVGKRRM